MKLDDAENLALVLMEDHGIGSTWSFAFDGAKRRCGVCNYNTRTISVSRHFVRMNDEAAVRDVVLHEIAHALVGPKADAHGSAWKLQAMRVGARPERCATNVVMPEGNVEGVCGPRCTARHTRHRMPPKHMLHGWQCKRCYEMITWVRVK